MLSSSVMDVVVGLSFLLLVLSTVASAIVELGRNAVNNRGRVLFGAIGEMLDGTPNPGPHSRTALLYRSPHLRSTLPEQGRPMPRRVKVGKGGYEADAMRFKGPKWIEPDTFEAAYAWLEHTERGDVPVARMTGVSELDATPEASMTTADQFSNRMARLSDDYRSRSRWWLFVVGLVAAVILHIDLVDVTRMLWQDDTVRAGVVELMANCETTDCISEAQEGVSGIVGLPIGWTCDDGSSCPIWQGIGGSDARAFIGFALTGAAVALGAPFWYDLTRLVPGRRRAD